jgi:hypothetical protein
MSAAGRWSIAAALAGFAIVGPARAMLDAAPVRPGTSPGGNETPRLHVDAQTFAVEPGTAFETTLSVTGAPADVAALTAAGAEIRVTVHEAIADVAQLERTEAGAARALDVAVLAAAPVLTGSGGTAEGSLSLPVSDGAGGRDSIDFVDAGIYPLTIDVAAGGVVATGSTFVEFLDPATPAQPLSVAIVAAADDVDAYRRLADVAGRTEAPFSVSLPPSVAVELASAPEASATAGEALRFDELVALPSAPLDPSAVVAVDEATAFTRLLRDGEDTLSAASPFAGVSRAVWISDRPISGAGAAMLRDLGVRMLVLTEDVAFALGADAGSAVFEVELGDGNSLPAMTIDRRGAQLAASESESVAATANERAVRLLAELRLDRRDGGPAAVVLAAPDLTVPDGDVTVRFAEFVDSLPDARVVPLSRLPGIAQGELRADGRALPLPTTAGADLTQRRDDVESLRAAAEQAATMITTSQRRDDWMRRLDALLASDLDDATVAQRSAELDAEIEAVLTAIVAPEPFTFTLTGSSNTLHLPIRNTSAEPLLVDIDVRSPKLAVDGPVQPIEVPALSSTDVAVPVQARSQGTFTIEVDVLAPGGHALGPPVVLKGRASEMRGLSQVATVGAVLILASWWFMHLRRRRARRLAQV